MHHELQQEQQQATIAAAASSTTAAHHLPQDVWRLIATYLDPWTQRQLRLACQQLLRLLPPLTASAVPLCSLADHRTFDSQRSYLVVGPPRRKIALSCLDTGRRCEQRLCVCCDNLAPSLACLDISTALPRGEISLPALDRLVDSLPGLAHIALPPCPAAPRAVLGLLAALPLQTCDLDCRLLDSSAALQEWGELRGMRRLRALQLQHVNSMPCLLSALSCTPQQLACISLRGMPAMPALDHLSHLTSLTRLELASTVSAQPCLGSNSNVVLNKGVHVAEAVAPWSGLQQLRELVLPDVYLDTQLLEATAACSKLTRLIVAGLQLQPQRHQHCQPRITGLQDLTATHIFDLGGALASDVLPALCALSMRVGHSMRHALASLQHHSALATLSVEAAAGVLQELHLAHLVRCPALNALCLAVAPAADGHHSAPPACLPVGLPSQVTSLVLRGGASDHALARLAATSPHLQRLTLDRCGFVSDGGLQKLTAAPALRLLLLQRCEHVSPWGLELLLQSGTLAAVAVHDCTGIPER